MAVEGGLTTIQQIVLVIVAAVILIGLAIVFSGKTEALGCGWADQAVKMFATFYQIFGGGTPPSVCG